MKIKEYLENLPIGEVVNKKALAYFKRIGYIWDYSRFGYLESVHIRGNDGYDNSFHLDISANGKCGLIEGFGAMYEKWRQSSAETNDYSSEQLREMVKPSWCFEWEGMRFRAKYYDGCFCPYLIKDSGPARGAVNHRFAFPDGVV